MINLEENNIIESDTGGVQGVEYGFPSFVALQSEIETMLKRKSRSEEPNIVKITTAERERFFDRNVMSVSNLPVRAPDGADEDAQKNGVELMDVDPNWKTRIPISNKIAVCGYFDELPTQSAKIKQAEFFGQQNEIVLRTGFGAVSFFFPPQDDTAFQKAVKKLMSERIRQRGRSFQDRVFQVRHDFFFENCQMVKGAVVGEREGKKEDIPANWWSTVCKVFEEQEALTESDAGE